MIGMIRSVPVLLLLFSIACASSNAVPVRTVEQAVRSSADPRLLVSIVPELAYIGHLGGSAMGGKAEYEQYVFSEVSEGRLGRTFIVHFEHAVPGVDFSFNYPRHTMVRLGKHEYLQQSWPIEKWPLFESPEMKKLLAKISASAPQRWLVNRYVRAIGKEKRSEIILFYLEPAGDLPAAVEDLGLGGARRDLWEPIQRALAERANAVFEVRD